MTCLASGGLQRTRRICVRVSPEEEAILKEAAWRRRLTLAEWLRRTMLREASKENGRDVRARTPQP